MSEAGCNWKEGILFAREMRETLRQALFILAFYALVPLLYLLDLTGVGQMSFLWYMSNGLNLNILVLAIYLSWNMFRPEERDRAMEYMLSIPVDRWSILMVKILPRILVLFPLLLIDQVLANNRVMIMDISLLQCMYIVSFLLFCGFVLGLIGRKRPLGVLILAAMTLTYMPIISTGWWSSLTWWFVMRARLRIFYPCDDVLRSIVSEVLPNPSFFLLRNCRSIDFILITSVIAVAAWPLMRKWEVAPARGRELLFARRAILPMLILAFPLLSCLFKIRI
jgi:hypothetical protein